MATYIDYVKAARESNRIAVQCMAEGKAGEAMCWRRMRDREMMRARRMRK